MILLLNCPVNVIWDELQQDDFWWNSHRIVRMSSKHAKHQCFSHACLGYLPVWTEAFPMQSSLSLEKVALLPVVMPWRLCHHCIRFQCSRRRSRRCRRLEFPFSSSTCRLLWALVEMLFPFCGSIPTFSAGIRPSVEALNRV